MLPALFIFVFLGTPVSFSLIIVSVIFAVITVGDMAGLQLFRFIGSVASNHSLAAVPLFVFMGALLEGSSMSARLFDLMKRWFGKLPGGMSVATLGLCTLFAAGTGIVAAVEVMVALLAIPVMLREGYDKKIISGVICAGGSLGTMIPPSVLIIVYASVSNQSVGALFAAVLYPATIMIGLFLGYVILHGWLFRTGKSGTPIAAAALLPGEDDADEAHASVWSLLPPLLLVLSVVGSILTGIASVTEAAAVGVLAALLLNLFYRDLTWGRVRIAIYKTINLTSMILFLVIGGTLFTSVFRLTGGSAIVGNIINSSDISVVGLIILLLAIVFILGTVLDWISVTLIAIPIFVPFLAPLGVDGVWFGVLVIIVLQTSYLTPPLAPSIFYLRGAVPGLFTYREMYLGVLPFIVCQLVVLALVLVYPELATALPEKLGLH